MEGTVFFVPKMNVVDFSLLECMEGLEKMWSAELYDM